MKINEFKNLDEAPLFGYLGQALGKKFAGTGMSSTQNQMAMDIFIDDFVDDAYGAIKAGVESGMINADANLPIAAAAQQDQQQQQGQQQDQTQQQQTKSTVPQGGGKIPGQLSQTPNAIRKRKQRAAGKVPGKNVGLGDLVNQLNPQKAKSTGGTITQTPRGYVHSANQKPATTQGNPKFLSKNKQQVSKQPATVKESKFTKLNKIFESVINLNEKGPTTGFSSAPTKIGGGFGAGPYNKPYSPLKLPQQPGKPAQQSKKFNQDAEDEIMRKFLNEPSSKSPPPITPPTQQQAPKPAAPAQPATAPAAPAAPAQPATAPAAPASSSQTSQVSQGGMGIAQYLKTKWFPFYMRGVQVDQSVMPTLDKLFTDVQKGYATDGGKQALNLLAKAGYNMAKGNIPAGAADIKDKLQSAGGMAGGGTDVSQLAAAINNLKATDKNAYLQLLKSIK